MLFRDLVVVCCVAGLVVAVGCSDDDSSTGPTVETTEYEGAIYDPVMDAAFAAQGLSYDSTRFVYSLSSDGNYQEEVYLMAWTTVEVGNWAADGATYTFTPVSDSMFNPQTMSMVEAPTKAAYTATEGADGSLTIENYTNIDDQRSLGTLVLRK
ncbi:MAG: hypothetical protein GF331_23120 [Chitinivibrionales bacterium]|nr:hypothetical protein [Chitinivibrionales bacterium]